MIELKGERFNRIAEHDPLIVREMAANLGLEDVGELRKLAFDGELTIDTLIDAIVSLSKMSYRITPPRPSPPIMPKPPICRRLKDRDFHKPEDSPDLCQKCGSSVERKYIFFGKKYCIQPECENHEGIK